MKPDVKPLPGSARQLINAVELLAVFGQFYDSGMGCAKDTRIAIMCGGTVKTLVVIVTRDADVRPSFADAS